MTEISEPSPVVEFAPDDPNGFPILEIKKHLILFVPSPPGPETVKRIMDLYVSRWGDPFVRFGATTPAAVSMEWEPSRSRFFGELLPRLRTGAEWGYAFTDGRKTNSWTLTFHGYGPFTEPEKSSFYRFEFDWKADSTAIRDFACDILGVTPCLSGYAGFAFQPRPRAPFARLSFDRMFAWAHRYWGVEAQDLDVTVNHMRTGYKSVSWVTIIGRKLIEENVASVATARKLAFDAIETSGAIVLQAGKSPVLGDRNRLEDLSIYTNLAKGLSPLQAKEHGAFGEGSESRWTVESTRSWLQRFQL